MKAAEIKGRVLKKIGDKNRVMLLLKGGDSGQALFGYSDEVMGALYKKAHRLLVLARTEDAINAFVFLATLNPGHSEYWMGLGAALQFSHDYEAAIDAYEMAAIHNMEHPLPYLYLAKCLFAIHDRKSALQAFELAIAYSEGIDEFSDIFEEAANAKEHLEKIE